MKHGIEVICGEKIKRRRSNRSLAVVAFLWTMVFGSFGLTFAEETEKKDPEAPEVKHAPVTSVARGVPVSINAAIASPVGSTLTSVTVLVRLTDVGTPISTPMQGKEDEEGTYNSILPVSMIRSVSVFWYAIDVRDQEGRIGGTPWIRVVIIDPYLSGGGHEEAGAVALLDRPATYIVGGLLLAGGAAVIIDNQNDDGKKDPPPVVEPPVLPPPSSNGGDDDDDNSGGGGGGGDPPATNGCPYATPVVSYANESYCESGSDIEVTVCSCAAPTEPVSVLSSSGAVGTQVSINGYCRTFNLPKEDGFPTPGTYTISVYVGANVVDTRSTPPESDNDCFFND